MKGIYKVLVLLLLLATTVQAEVLEFTFAFSADDLHYQSRENGFLLPELKDCELPQGNPGMPWLPVRHVNILLPNGSRATRIRFQADYSTVHDDILIYPEQPEHPLSIPIAPEESFVLPQYGTAVYPEQTAVLLDNLTMRGRNFASIQINPLKYYPAEQRLALATNITLTVHCDSPDSRTDLQTAEARPPNSVLFDTLLNAQVINPLPPEETAQRALDESSPTAACDYLIITSAALSNSFQQLANFRTTHNGLNTRVVTVEYITANYNGTRPDGSSDTQTRIRNCISNYVHTMGTVYVVLGGDSSIIPDRDCYVSCGSYTESHMPTDLYYGGLDGTWDGNANGTYGETADGCDLAYDVIVGRIPIRTTTQADDYINKLITFENTPKSDAFAGKMLLLGDKLWNTYTDASRPTDVCYDGLSAFNAHSPVSDAEIWIRRLFRDGMSDWTNHNESMFFDTLTSWDSSTAGDYLQSSGNVQNQFNRGWNHVYFGTHGGSTIWGLESGSYGTSSAASLTNLTALVYTMACLTGRFDDVDPCLSEAFIRNGNGGGALVYMGCSRYGWGSPGSYSGGTSMRFAYKFYEEVFTNLRTNIGVAFAEHKLALASSSTYNGSYRWVQFGLNLQGDPLVPVQRPGRPPPGNESFRFTAFAQTNSVSLRWNDPYDCGMPNSEVRIEYDTSAYPETPSSGTLAYEGDAQSFSHTNLTIGQCYYYSVWVNDGNGWTNPPSD